MDSELSRLDPDEITAGNAELYVTEEYVANTGEPNDDYSLSRREAEDPLEGSGHADDGFDAIPRSNW